MSARGREYWLRELSRQPVEVRSSHAASLLMEIDAQRAELLDALRDVFAIIDEGYLVRDIVDDGRPGWAMRQLPYVRRLVKARAAIAKATGQS